MEPEKNAVEKGFENVNQLLWYLLAGTRGGETRARIIASLLEKPANANQLAQRLQMDYKTIQHHLKILVENKLLDAHNQGGYGAAFFPSKELLESIGEFRQIWGQFGNNLGKTT